MRYRRFHDRPGRRARAHRARAPAARGHRGARHRRDRLRLPRAPTAPSRCTRSRCGYASSSSTSTCRRSAGEAIFHVRGYTKGVPSVNDNNHPVRYGRTVVVHNGHLDNDDALFRRHGVAALDAAHHGRLRGHRDAGRPQRRYRGGAHRGARQRSRGRALGRRARTADARAPRVAAALPRPWRRLRALRLDRGAARARSARDGPARARSRRSPRAARWSCARASSSRAAASTVDRRYVGQALVTYPPLAEKPALLRLALAAF